MTATRFTMGLALLAATGCAQISADAPVSMPPFQTTGATSVSYDPPAPLRRTLPPVAALTYQVSAPLPQSRAVYEPAYPRPLPPARATYEPAAPRSLPPSVSVPAPVQVAALAPVRVASPARIVVQPVAQAPARSAPRSFVVAPDYRPAPAAIPAPEAEERALTLRERIAVFGTQEPERPQSMGRQFQIIEVAELNDPSRRPASDANAAAAFSGVQITTADPFTIPTRTGQPYYQGSTPPAIEYQIPHIPQEEPLWCWAAAAQQAIGWVNNGRAPAQCAIVALAHGIDVEECCADREGVCARTGEIPAIEKLVERFGGRAEEMATVPRDPKVIYDILRRGDTVLIRLRPAPHDEAVGIRHMIVVRGIEWLRLPNNQLQATLLYNDPLGSGERAVNFDEIEGFFEQAMIISRN